MKKPIYYYHNEVPHFDEYNVGPCPAPPRPCPPPPCKPCHHYHGKVGIVGKTVLTVRYIDSHGYVQEFDICDGETYEIKALSQTKGICTFAGRIVDFECSKGIEKLISKPHIINVTALIVDYSDAYESKLLRIGIDNIISIKPIRCFDGMHHPPMDEHEHHHTPDWDRRPPMTDECDYNIKDPFDCFK